MCFFFIGRCVSVGLVHSTAFGLFPSAVRYIRPPLAVLFPHPSTWLDLTPKGTSS